jgi:hypothetical protein
MKTKGSVQQSTTPDPSLSKKWNRGLPSSDEEGWGVVGGLAQTLPLNVCDAPQAQFGQIVPLGLTCPFGTSQTPEFGVCAIRE